MTAKLSPSCLKQHSILRNNQAFLFPLAAQGSDMMCEQDAATIAHYLSCVLFKVQRTHKVKTFKPEVSEH